MTIDLDPALRTQVRSWMVVTTGKAFSPERAIEIKRELGNTCHGIDPWWGLEVCAMQILGIEVNGRREYIPASRDLGFNIDLSHKIHGRNWPLRSSPEGVTCQCLACHMLYSLGIGQRGGRNGNKKWGAVAINERLVYTEDARLSRKPEFSNLNFSLKHPIDVLHALGRKLQDYGVVWTYGQDVFVPEVWEGPGGPNMREDIVDIARRLYAPKRDPFAWADSPDDSGWRR